MFRIASPERSISCSVQLPPEHERKLRTKNVLPEYREWERR